MWLTLVRLPSANAKLAGSKDTLLWTLEDLYQGIFLLPAASQMDVDRTSRQN